MKLYRYDRGLSWGGRIKIDLSEYSVIKETPCGYWIPRYSTSYYRDDEKRWVSNCTRKRFAYPTKEEALKSFVARKNRQVKILTAQLDTAKRLRHEARRMVEQNA